jgi:hypothetical protein
MLYFAEDPITATFEFGAMLGNPFVPGGAVAHPARAFAILMVFPQRLQSGSSLVFRDQSGNVVHRIP